MDAIDTRILMLLQEDASISIAELAQKVNLSQTPCWKRVQRLEASGSKSASRSWIRRKSDWD